MKKYIFLLLSASVASGQNFAIKTGADLDPNSWERTNGIGLHVPVEFRSIGTSTNAPIGFSVALTPLGVETYTNTWASEISSWKNFVENYRSNQVWIAKRDSDVNLARLIELYQQIPTARATIYNFATNTSNLTTAQLTTATRQLANYVEKEMEFIQRLGPLLKSLYKPEQDGVSPVQQP
jgi:hypothetical protein